MLVVRVLNNNAVVADDDGREVVAMGPGVGFRRKCGDDLPAADVERVFAPSATQPIDRLGAFLADIPPSHLAAAAAIAQLAADRLGVVPTQALVIALADHLNFAIRRSAEGVGVEYPLAWEIAQLYPEHLELGRAALDVVSDRLQVTLPRQEAVSFAMHVINAQSAGDPSSTVSARQVQLVAQILDVIDATFGVTVDRESMSAARFVTHLRYVFVRIAGRRQLDDTPATLVDSIAAAYPDAIGCASRITYLVQLALGAPVTPDETAFVTLHVARLLGDLRQPELRVDGPVTEKTSRHRPAGST